MAGVKISALPAIPSSAFSDVGPWVQGGVTYQASLTQISTLFGFNGSGILTLAKGGTSANLTAANGAIPYSTAMQLALLAAGSSGQLFQSGGAGAPNWTTPTYPSASGAAGKILRADGTNNVYSTSIFADTYLINTLLFNASANTVSGLATANNGLLVTDNTGIPSILAGPGATGKVLQSNAALAPSFSTAQYPSTAGSSGNVIVSDGTNYSSSATTGITALGAQAQTLNMNSHLISNGLDPVSAQDFATKNYVDTTALNGTSVYAATTSNLNVTQAGVGVGATLTDASGTFAAFAVDSVSPPLNSNSLIKNLAIAASHQGIYTLTRQGDNASIPYQLTRATSYDSPVEINNTGLIIVNNGATLAGTGWYNTATIATVDTTNFSFSQFGSSIPSTGTAGLALLSTGAGSGTVWSTKPPITQVNVQIISATALYMPTNGTKFLTTEIIGGGGGGGGTLQNGAGTTGLAAGGGGAGYCKKTYNIAQLGANAAVVIGTGGNGGAAGNNAGTDGIDSTFTPAGAGAILTGSKGKGGGSGGTASATTSQSNPAGIGGTGTNGDLNISGQDGTPSVTVLGVSGFVLGGVGGGTALGTGAGNPSFVSATTGKNGNAYGSGGAGGFAVGAASAAGGNGANGVCIVTEYISV